MHRVLLIVAGLICLCCTGGNAATTKETATATGTVKESVSQGPLANAVVTIGDQRDTTDPNGRYTISGITPGEQKVRVDAPGYWSESIDWRFFANEYKVNVSTTLRPEPKLGSVDMLPLALDSISHLVHDPIHNIIIAASANGKVSDLTTSSGYTFPARKVSETLTGLAYSPNGRSLAIATGKSVQFVLQVSGAQDEVLVAPATSVAYANNETLIVGNTDGALSRWETHTGKLLSKVSLGVDPVVGLSLSGDRKLLLVVTGDGRLELRSSSTLKLQRAFRVAGLAKQAALSADGRTIGVINRAGKALVIMTSSAMASKMLALGEPIVAMVATSQGQFLVAGKQSIKLWEPYGHILANIKVGQGKEIGTIVASPDGKYAYAGLKTSEILRWRLR